MPDTPVKIEVLGNAKTGTTGLFNSIRAPLREQHPDALLLFEPRSSALDLLTRHEVPYALLAKAMINKNGLAIGYDAFNRHVLIARDPRDTLVSQLLYLPLQPHGVRGGGAANLDAMLDALRAKELDPTSSSFREVFELGIRLMDRDPAWSWDKYLERFTVAERINDTYECFVLQYEDFTDRRLDGLSSYLGLLVEPVVPDRVEDLNGHVVRTATHGEWRNWFVERDVDFFRPLFKTYMDAFGYDDDWTLAEHPVIPPETATGYVLARRPVVEAKMTSRFQPKREWRLEQTDATEAEALRVAADERDAGRSGYRYAMLLLEGRVVPYDPQRAFAYAYRSALASHLSAAELVTRMYREGIGTSTDFARARAWEAEAEQLRDAAAPPVPPAAPKPPPPSIARRAVRKLRRAAGGNGDRRPPTKPA
jgi:hypothetical protein